MCLTNPVGPLTKSFQRIVSPHDHHGYVTVYKWMVNPSSHIIVNGKSVPAWMSPYCKTLIGPGFQKALGEEVHPKEYGFYGCLTSKDAMKERPYGGLILLLQCLVKKSWILGVEGGTQSFVGRCIRCSHMVFPEYPNTKVTVREFRRICREAGV